MTSVVLKTVFTTDIKTPTLVKISVYSGTFEVYFFFPLADNTLHIYLQNPACKTEPALH